jgi:hypothetical protein
VVEHSLANLVIASLDKVCSRGRMQSGLDSELRECIVLVSVLPRQVLPTSQPLHHYSQNHPPQHRTDPGWDAAQY